MKATEIIIIFLLLVLIYFVQSTGKVNNYVWVTGLYSNNCYIMGEEPNTIKRRIPFDSLDECRDFVFKKSK